jgi:hypothetical protein
MISPGCQRTLALAETRLKRMDDELQERLINWSRLRCGAAKVPGCEH